MKIAASLDGQTALANGSSQWITGEAARADGHAWRARAGAVLTGIGTVLETTRGWTCGWRRRRQPPLVVVDRPPAGPPPDAALFGVPQRRSVSIGGATAQRSGTEARGAQNVHHCPAAAARSTWRPLAAGTWPARRRQTDCT
jgi:diaminohydroxyphosphoribosylaminopyrimidine deaminase/5-amino-6-(5-phosphoribosylamino)uracil reductase